MRKLKYVKLHDATGNYHIPGVGALGTTLPPQNKTFSDFAMYDDNGTLRVFFKSQNKGKELAIPGTNASVIEYETSSSTVVSLKNTDPAA